MQNEYKSMETDNELQFQSELITNQMVYQTQQQQLDNYNEQLEELNEKLISQSTKDQLNDQRMNEYKNQNMRLTLQIEGNHSINREQAYRSS